MEVVELCLLRIRYVALVVQYAIRRLCYLLNGSKSFHLLKFCTLPVIYEVLWMPHVWSVADPSSWIVHAANYPWVILQLRSASWLAGYMGYVYATRFKIVDAVQ